MNSTQHMISPNVAHIVRVSGDLQELHISFRNFSGGIVAASEAVAAYTRVVRKKFRRELKRDLRKIRQQRRYGLQ